MNLNRPTKLFIDISKETPSNLHLINLTSASILSKYSSL